MPFSFLISQCLASAAPHRGVRFSSPAGFRVRFQSFQLPPLPSPPIPPPPSYRLFRAPPRAATTSPGAPRRGWPTTLSRTCVRPSARGPFASRFAGHQHAVRAVFPAQPAPISRGSGVSPPVVAAPRFPSRSPWRGATSVPLAVQISLQLLVGLVTTVATLRVVGPETNVSLSRRGGIHPTATSARCSWPPRCFYVPIALICFGWLQLHPLACCSFSPVS